ncbi:MAG: glutathione S-transferase family protein [Pseudomonadota bacterium]
MLKVWGRANSSNVQAVMWCIAELDLPYERYDVGHKFGGTDTPEFIAMNPNRTVPVLRDGDGPALWESAAILRYLGAAYGPSLWPEDPMQRADVDRWAEWAKINVVIGFSVPIFWRVVRTAPANRDPEAIAVAIQSLAGKLAIAEAQLAERPFLAGESLSLADMQLGHMLFRYFDIEIERPDLPNLRAYYNRLTERPAYRDHVMVSYEDLRVI